jgi:AcrR family transcriptional regulator
MDLPTAPAKLRILTTSDSLFYDEGIRAVGVDRLIAESNVTKATFYKHYGSKDLLVDAYLSFRHRREAESIDEIVAHGGGPEAALRGILAGLLDTIESPDFRGCPFLNTAAEFAHAGHPIRAAVREHRDWYNSVLADLLRELGHALPGEAADDLQLARDGAMCGGYAGDPVAATRALTRAFERVLGEART